MTKKSSYKIDDEKQAIIHQGFNEDERGFCIIAWLVEFVGDLAKRNQKTNTILCSNKAKSEIIKAFSFWTVLDDSLIQVCQSENTIPVGNNLVFKEIKEEGIIYLSWQDDVYPSLAPANAWMSAIDWGKVAEIELLKELA